jgi:hypothetical protein
MSKPVTRGAVLAVVVFMVAATLASSAAEAAPGWLAPVNLSPKIGQDAYEPQVALDAQGDALAVWALNGLEASVRPAAGGAWQTPVSPSDGAGGGESQLSSDGPNADAGSAHVAVDPRGNAVAVWQRVEEGLYAVQGVAYDAAGPLLNALAIPESGIAGQPLSFSVSPLDVWSALTTTWNFGDGTAVGGTSVTHTYTAAGTYKVVLTSVDALGNASSASATITIAPAPTSTSQTSASTTVPPSVTDVTQSHSRWREGDHLASFARRSKAPLGTMFSFTLNEPARLSFDFIQQVPGHKVKGKCLARTKKNRKRADCARAVTEGTLSFAGHAGKNKVSFQGRISALRKLEPGRYTLLIAATNATGQRSQTQSLSFTIVA